LDDVPSLPTDREGSGDAHRRSSAAARPLLADVHLPLDEGPMAVGSFCAHAVASVVDGEFTGTEQGDPSVGVTMIKITLLGVSAIALAAMVGGCELQAKKTAQQVQAMPVNCATADGDLRTLDSEKKTTMERISAGVRSVVPASLVVGVVAGTAGTKYQIATGKYNEMIDDKIADIKQACPDAVAQNTDAADAPAATPPNP
jgi:hypothetical protein